MKARPSRRLSTLLLAAASFGAPVHARAQDAEAAAKEAAQAIRMIKAPKGLSIDVWATEPLLQNVVSIAFDEKGRVYVAETNRIANGVLDNRGRGGWPTKAYKDKLTPAQREKLNDEILDAELASRSLADREALLRKYFVGALETFTAATERVLLVEDKDGDGKAETTSVFADGFNSMLDGVASGVLAWRGNVYFTNIPSLWSLRDKDGDGKADEKKELSRGYGLHYGFMGHDLHGLRLGPDGKLYFSIGDRGFRVETEGRVLDGPATGAVFRCNPDGSELEVVATGLRNPQELAFDDQGNLFTGDNNSDGGDKARFVQILEGGDSGWRVGYQYLESPVRRGPWNDEKLWHPPWQGQAAYIVPPIANVTNGPSGLAFHPGTGVPSKYKDHFFLVDFRGQANTSGVHAIRLAPDGAGFKMVKDEQFAWGVLATDVDFGPDGGLYVTDWVYGWRDTGKGRIYRIGEPAYAKSPAAAKQMAEVKALLGSGLAGKSEAELATLLGHADRRVRTEAQYRLAEAKASASLLAAARASKSPLARLHGIWGLGQIIRPRGVDQLGKPATRPQPVADAPAGVVDALVALLADKDPEVRAQAAKVLGDARRGEAQAGLTKLLTDAAPRPRLFAAQALGKLGKVDAIAPLVAFVAQNDADPYLRHAGTYALALIGDVPALLASATTAPPAGRRAVTVALRRLARPEIARFLQDADPSVVREAARAINDVPIEGATLPLAALVDAALGGQSPAALDPVVLVRAINASFRQGRTDDAARLARLASDARIPLANRRDAVLALGEWGAPSGRDRVTGNWRPMPATKRDAALARTALGPALPRMLSDGPDELRLAAIGSAGKLGIKQIAGELVALLRRADVAANVRLQALRALEATNAPEQAAALELAAKDPELDVRLQALKLRVKLQPKAALDVLREVVASGSARERQVAVRLLGDQTGEAADRLIADLLDEVVAGKAAPEVTLDVLEAAGKRGTGALKQKLAAFEDKRPQDDLGPYREALVGGDAQAGKGIFFNRGDLSCPRCHSLEGHGGEVGPELHGIGSRRTREYLLEAVVYPSKHFAPGFEQALVTMKDGKIHGGTVRKESAAKLELQSPDEGTLQLAKASIKLKEPGASGMPDGFGSILSKRELRDLVEFLASLK